MALLHINSNYYFYDYDCYCAYYYQTCLTLGSVCNCCRPLSISTDAGPQLVDTAPVGCSFCFFASLGLSYLKCSYFGCKSIYMTKVFGSLLNRNQYMHEDRLITIFASCCCLATIKNKIFWPLHHVNHYNTRHHLRYGALFDSGTAAPTLIIPRPEPGDPTFRVTKYLVYGWD